MNSDRQFHFDLDRYTRTHGLFDAKRARLAPEAIELLAREVVERLAAARIGDDGGNSASVEPTINPDLVDTFCDILLKQDAYSASQFLQTPTVIMGIVVIAAIAYAFDMLMRFVERKVVPWKGKV